MCRCSTNIIAWVNKHVKTAPRTFPSLTATPISPSPSETPVLPTLFSLFTQYIYESIFYFFNFQEGLSAFLDIYVSFLWYINWSICFWLHLVFVAVCGRSLAAVGKSYSLVVMRRLIYVISPVAEHGFQSLSSRVVVHGLSCPTACGVFLDQGSNPCPLHWQMDS